MDSGKTPEEKFCFGRLFGGFIGEEYFEDCAAAEFEKNEILFCTGDFLEYCGYVESGRIASFEILACGEERLYGFFEKGSVIGLENMLLGTPMQLSMKAFLPSSVRIIKKEKLLEKLLKNNGLCLKMIESLSAKQLSMEDQLQQTCSETASGKICELLLRFSDEFGRKCGRGTVLAEKISQQTIASMLGINRITVARTMKELRSLGLAYLSEGFYCLPDTEALRRYQEGVDQFYAVG